MNGSVELNGFDKCIYSILAEAFNRHSISIDLMSMGQVLASKLYFRFMPCMSFGWHRQK